jgi:hypothetical protein
MYIQILLLVVGANLRKQKPDLNMYKTNGEQLVVTSILENTSLMSCLMLSLVSPSVVVAMPLSPLMCGSLHPPVHIHVKNRT